MESFLWGYGKLAEEGIVCSKIQEKDDKRDSCDSCDS